ncbi:MAG: hypothetical protein IK097_06010 [Clostridia bacterium]|nr:hypothetical protein [Clostridia bacterium]
MKKIISIILALFIVCGYISVAFAYNPDDFENKYGGKDVTDKVSVMVDAPAYMLDKCKLIVNGNEISDHIEDVKIYYDGNKTDSHNVQAQIPFITVIKELGAKVFWFSDNTAIIIFRGVLFYLNIDKKFLATSNPLGWPMINLFQPLFLAGGVYIGEYTKLKRECIIDNRTDFQFFCALSGGNIKTNIDLETATITIESK